MIELRFLVCVIKMVTSALFALTNKVEINKTAEKSLEFPTVGFAKLSANCLRGVNRLLEK